MSAPENEFKIQRDKLVPISASELEDMDSVWLLKKCIRNILAILGDDPDREGLIDTPLRVAKMYHEVYEGMKYTNEQIAQMFDKCFEEGATGDLVTMGDIEVFSYCEHHLALMYNMKVHVGYLPNGKVIGLSKIARIADMVAKRLQLQERVGSDIADILEMILDTSNVIVVVEGEHSCMTARGIRKTGTKTRTATLRGVFSSDSDLRNEFYSLIGIK